MKLNINISNKVVYTAFVAVFFLVLIIGISAYNSGGPPSVIGHSADELDLTGLLSSDYEYVHWHPETTCVGDSEMGDSCPPRMNKYECPDGYVVVGVVFYEGIGSGISDAIDNGGVLCRKLGN